jgi:hypothetical protein
MGAHRAVGGGGGVWPRPVSSAPVDSCSRPVGTCDVHVAAWLRHVQGRQGQTRYLNWFENLNELK